jgi:hypothetical protein
MTRIEMHEFRCEVEHDRGDDTAVRIYNNLQHEVCVLLYSDKGLSHCRIVLCCRSFIPVQKLMIQP